MKRVLGFVGFIIFLILMACSHPIRIEMVRNELPQIFPDYTGVTIPSNIAPLNFKLIESENKTQAAIFKGNGIKFEIRSRKGQFQIPESQWSELLNASSGNEFEITVCIREKTGWIAYAPFKIKVAKETIDPYIAYRLIEPGYEAWNEMGIYQRNLENFTQTAILENKTISRDCMNCHSFCMQNPDQMMMHIRGANAATMVIIDGKVQKLNTKTNETISALVYPSWHPSGKFIAFSVNDTKQDFHSLDMNRIEVYDTASDVVVYDIEKHEIFTSEALFSNNSFESFPTFSPDGKTLYFSSAEAREMPDEFEEVKYSICSIEFNPTTKEFGKSVDTIFNAGLENKSASFPRVSPNGKYLLYTKGNYGGFFIWHKEADLFIYNIETEEHYPLSLANSDDAESYHSWSSNSCWIVYSSRRLDGLYTRLCIAYINNLGEAEKAFIIPQKDVEYYDNLMKSYNVPEFVKNKVGVTGHEIAREIKARNAVNVKFSKH